MASSTLTTANIRHPPILIDNNGNKYDGFSAKLATRNVEDNVKLIELIKDCPILYDSSLAGYKDTLKKEETWIAISRIMEWPVELCQTRWKSLRDSFRKKDKKLPPESAGGQDSNSQANNHVATWRYRELLSFLRDKNYRRKYSLEINNVSNHHLSFEASSLPRSPINEQPTNQDQRSPNDYDDDQNSQLGGDIKPQIAVLTSEDNEESHVQASAVTVGILPIFVNSPVESDQSQTSTINNNSATNQHQENVLAVLGLSNDATSPSTSMIKLRTSPERPAAASTTAVQRISPKSAQKILQALASTSANKRKSTLVHQQANGLSSSIHDSSSILKRHRMAAHSSNPLNHQSYHGSPSSFSLNHHNSSLCNNNNGSGGIAFQNTTDESGKINNSASAPTAINNNNSINSMQDNFLRKEYDEDDLFGLSIAASLRKCSEEQKLTAKIEIMRILHVVQHK